MNDWTGIVMMWRPMRVFLVGGLLANWTSGMDNYVQLYHTVSQSQEFGIIQTVLTLGLDG